jgi:hypothetical protein
LWRRSDDGGRDNAQPHREQEERQLGRGLHRLRAGGVAPSSSLSETVAHD